MSAVQPSAVGTSGPAPHFVGFISATLPPLVGTRVRAVDEVGKSVSAPDPRSNFSPVVLHYGWIRWRAGLWDGGETPSIWN